MVKKDKEEILKKSSLANIFKESDNPKYMEMRSSFRVRDSFPLEFYLQTPTSALKKKESYILTSTKDRRKTFLLEKGIIPPELFFKIEAMESDMFDVFSDIYRRIAVLSGKNIEPGDREEQTKNIKPENLGTCVDLSGGGLKFLCRTKFKPNDILKILISPKDVEYRFSISALVEVCKVILVEDGGPSQRYAVRVKYYAVNEDDLEIITQYTVLHHMEMGKSKKDQS